MKRIEPVSIWVNGSLKQANFINMYIVNDNLRDSATFYYALIQEEDNLMLANGNLTMSGEEYEAWDESGNINDNAYIWGAKKLNLVIIDEPIPEENNAPEESTDIPFNEDITGSHNIIN